MLSPQSAVRSFIFTVDFLRNFIVFFEQSYMAHRVKQKFHKFISLFTYSFTITGRSSAIFATNQSIFTKEQKIIKKSTKIYYNEAKKRIFRIIFVVLLLLYIVCYKNSIII